jgi:TolA-binding protein
VFNAQQKFKEAAEMSAEAGKRVAAVPGAAGASANILYNQGAIAWNANDFQKAKEHFESAIKADPNHAESHFMLGKVLINLGKLGEAATEFETYLKVAPSGQNAKEAQSMFDQLKSFRK